MKLVSGNGRLTQTISLRRVVFPSANWLMVLIPVVLGKHVYLGKHFKDPARENGNKSPITVVYPLIRVFPVHTSAVIV
jgi:hypothetical protein